MSLTRQTMKILHLLLIPVFAVIMTFAYASNYDEVGANPQIVKTQIKSKNAESEDVKYAAYLIDGTASASKLAAQRSHTVAGKDERNFSIFTGITVILMVYFFSQFEFFDK